MAFEPQFAVDPFVYRGVDARIEDLKHLPEIIRFDIASREEDIRGWEQTIACNQKEIPVLEHETLVCQRDVAEARLEIIALRAKLNGGK